MLPLLFASAQHVDVGDRNDTEGPLDIRRVSVEGIKEPKWHVKTWRRWSVESVFDSGFGLVYFDTFGNDRFDYYAFVRSNGFRLLGSLWRDRTNKADKRISSLKVSRPNKKSFKIRVPLRKMRFPTKRLRYNWYVQTLISSRACPRVCFDRAPDRGSILEPGRRRPSPQPTLPTPTPIPTITP